ncbi:DUF2142 domain-containing protein [Arcanobacterium phocae]|uniref:DUF2142 domain-containing protein n=1 Tax=Arcanobacterium phocae TaxID=131112 RepID=UPI001C0F25E5|nr:DUF2142 domain-containing protein [Arcanobacterium phocae]
MKVKATNSLRKSQYLYALLAVGACISFFIAGLGWVLASPIGGSPDDDYHMGSIWCPMPADGSCVSHKVDGSTSIEVPESVAKSAECHAFKPEESGECTTHLSDDKKALTQRYNSGSYPNEYYSFQHLLVGKDVGTSILTMRAMNLFISITLIALTAYVMPRTYRWCFLLAIFVAWMPMGWYFISSINPSSWSLTGTIVYAGGLIAALYQRGKFQYFALILAFLGGLLNYFSRGDAAVFVLIVSFGLLLFVPWKQWDRKIIAFSLLMSVAGVLKMFSGNQIRNIADPDLAPHRSWMLTLYRGLLQFPEYLAGFFGYQRGPGWFDTRIDGPITVMMLVAAGGILFIGLNRMSWRSGLSIGMFLGALFGIPFVTTLTGAQPELIMYQPRYMLPLVAVVFTILLIDLSTQSGKVSRVQSVFFLLVLGIVHTLSLKKVLWRYVSGMVGEEPFNLDFNIRWWWNISLSPMSIWVISSVFFIVALSMTLGLVIKNISKNPLIERAQA